MNKEISKILVVPKGGRFVPGGRKRFFYPDSGELNESDYQALTATLDVLEKNLIKNDFDYTVVLKPDRKIMSRFDLVITVGGDGTFLRTAHLVENTPMMGINSNPKVSIGALLSIKPSQIEKKLIAIKKGNYKTLVRQRIGITVNGKKLPVYPLNDILFANNSPAAMSRYQVKLVRHKENQRSSGVWVATSSGSTAAIKAAGGRPMPLSKKMLQYLVREPYKGLGEKKYKILRGFIEMHEELVFINEMHRAGLFLDGTQGHFSLAYGDKISVFLSRFPLTTLL
ncbi:NAD(+)/NADH kinase [bacterium]|nr:NAD(+)/NADH kinase [bacterium]